MTGRESEMKLLSVWILSLWKEYALWEEMGKAGFQPELRKEEGCWAGPEESYLSQAKPIPIQISHLCY